MVYTLMEFHLQVYNEQNNVTSSLYQCNRSEARAMTLLDIKPHVH